MAQKTDGSDWLEDDELDPGQETGDDWESAFQAEDFEFSPDENKDDLFAGGAESANPYEFTPPDEQELADLPDLGQGTKKTDPANSGESLSPAARNRAAGAIVSLWQTARERLGALPLIHKCAVGGGSLLIVILALTTVLPALFPSQVAELPHSSPDPPSIVVSPDLAAQRESIFQRWQFEPFVLPVATAESTEKAIFLEVDLTFLLVLAPDEELPLDRKIFIRDLIYQYYQQQPYDTLRHFALARGDMNRTLLAWLREQWHEATIETIIFNRYQLR